MAGGIPEYPDDSLQSLAGRWWIDYGDAEPVRGCLMWAFVPHVGLEPMTLEATGRTDARDHGSATYTVEPLRIKAPRRTRDLPVAALPVFPGEVRTVHRSKRRPVLVLSIGGSDVPRGEVAGSAKWMTNPTMIVAPYYGGEADGTRGGWPEPFRTRIRHCEYPQFIWDKLPIGGAEESILKLDHLQPVGRHHTAYEQTAYRLSEEALRIVDEWLGWLMTGKLPTTGSLAVGREMLRTLE